MYSESSSNRLNTAQRHTAARKPKPVFVSTAAAARRYFGWLLARREYSQAELQSRARRKGYLPDDIADALAFVQKHGFQDDTRYAESKVRQSLSRWGNRRIKQVLQSKQLSKDIVEAQDLPDEVDRAINIIQKYQAQPLSPELTSKIWRTLANRGFASASIKAALAHLKQLNQDVA